MFGMGTVTRDLATNLEWLDLDLTTAYSFNSVMAEFGSGRVSWIRHRYAGPSQYDDHQ